MGKKILNTISEYEVYYDTKYKPFLVRCNDLEKYVCKHQFGKKDRLIIELICTEFLKILTYNTPDYSLVNVKREHLKKGDSYLLKYVYFEHPVFGSKYIENSTFELRFAKNFNNKVKKQLRYDLLKISLFDLWLANLDRNNNNPNLLLINESKPALYAIDHDSCFNDALFMPAQLTLDETIMSLDLFKYLFSKQKNYKSLLNEIFEDFKQKMVNCVTNIEKILSECDVYWNINTIEYKEKISQYCENDWIKEVEKNFYYYFEFHKNK